jgi:pyridoxal 5'-phosphate synthase pdxT subunit
LLSRITVGGIDYLLTTFRLHRKPTWGTCAGLILLAESANRTKQGGQELIGGLDVRVNRNHFGRQVESFVADLNLPFLQETNSTAETPGPAFQGIFIRAPIVEKILPYVEGEQREEEKRQETVIAPSRHVEDTGVRESLSQEVEILGVLSGRAKRAGPARFPIDIDAEAGDIIAVRQGNVFGTSFHPELTGDVRIHVWWLMQLVQSFRDLGK